MIRIGCRAHDYGKHTPARPAQNAPETPLIRDEVLLEHAPADIQFLQTMRQTIEAAHTK